ncbi:hypothetical protein SRHO_G00030910, partial [Serrasalmus rhombeus]
VSGFWVKSLRGASFVLLFCSFVFLSVVRICKFSRCSALVEMHFGPFWCPGCPFLPPRPLRPPLQSLRCVQWWRPTVSGKESEECDVRKEGKSSEITRSLSLNRLTNFCDEDDREQTQDCVDNREHVMIGPSHSSMCFSVLV